MTHKRLTEPFSAAERVVHNAWDALRRAKNNLVIAEENFPDAVAGAKGAYLAARIDLYTAWDKLYAEWEKDHETQG